MCVKYKLGGLIAVWLRGASWGTFMADTWTKCLFYLSFEKLEPQQKIIFPIIKVFPKDTSFFSLPHARRRPSRRAIVAIWKDIKRTGAEYAVRAILRIYSAIETSLCRLKRKSFGIVVFLCRRLRSHPIHYQAIHTNETSILCASLRSVGIPLSSFVANKIGSLSFGNKVYSARLTTRLGEL